MSGRTKRVRRAALAALEHTRPFAWFVYHRHCTSGRRTILGDAKPVRISLRQAFAQSQKSLLLDSVHSADTHDEVSASYGNLGMRRELMSTWRGDCAVGRVVPLKVSVLGEVACGSNILSKLFFDELL